MNIVLAAVIGMLCFAAAACSQVSTEEANLPDMPEAQRQVEVDPKSGEPLPTADATALPEGSATALPEGSATALPEGSSDGSDGSADDGRGARAGADEEFEAAAVVTATPVPTTAPVLAAQTASDESDETDEPEETDASGEADSTGDVEEPTATPVPTATPAATQAAAPPATQVRIVTQDPEPVFIAPTPTGPVPSDEIVVQGPTVDESEASDISVSGASACALAETAIDLLDRGDLARAGAALAESSQVAAQASESSITSMASQLANAGANEDAAIAAIIAMLNACAQHGYQV